MEEQKMITLSYPEVDMILAYIQSKPLGETIEIYNMLAKKIKENEAKLQAVKAADSPIPETKQFVRGKPGRKNLRTA
jgi:hypothetical protein